MFSFGTPSDVTIKKKGFKNKTQSKKTAILCIFKMLFISFY